MVVDWAVVLTDNESFKLYPKHPSVTHSLGKIVTKKAKDGTYIPQT